MDLYDPSLDVWGSAGRDSRPALAPDGLTACVAHQAADADDATRLVVVDLTGGPAGEVVGRFGTDDLRAAAAAAGAAPQAYRPVAAGCGVGGRSVVVADVMASSSLWRLDLGSFGLGLVRFPGDDTALEVAVTDDRAYVMLVSYNTATTYLSVDLASGQAVRSNWFMSDAFGGEGFQFQMAATPNGRWLCVIARPYRIHENTAPGRLHVIPTSALFAGALPPDPGREVGLRVRAVAATDDHAYVASADPGGGTVTVVGIGGASGVHTVSLGAEFRPSGIAVSSTGQWIYVSDRAAGSVALVDGRTFTVVETIPVGPEPSGMTVSRDDRILGVRTTGPTEVETRRVRPVVHGLDPATLAVPTGSTTRVRLTGTGLDGASDVWFGNAPAEILGAAPGWGHAPGTTLEVVPPAGTGFVRITVRTAAGVSHDEHDALFEYLPLPTIATLEPDRTPLGGRLLTLTGTDLTDAQAVRFDTDGTVVEITALTPTPTGLTVVAPAHDQPGTVAVSVRTPVATSAPVPLRYLPPARITTVEPPGGPVAGGTSVTVSGTGLADTTAVTLDGTDLAFDTPTATTVTVTTREHAAGPVDLVVHGPGGDAHDRYTFHGRPTVADLQPRGGPLTGGGTLKITGSDLAPTTSVVLDPGGGDPLAFTADDDTVTVTAPAAGAGAVRFRVRGPGGEATTPAYTYTRPPQLDRLDPAAGPVDARPIRIIGTALTYTDAVLLDGTPVDGFTAADDSTLTVPLPGHAPGPVAIQAHNPAGTSNPLDFTHVPRPTLDTPAAPLTGHADQLITLTGTNLGPVETLTIGTTDIPRPKLVVFGPGGTTLRFFAPDDTGHVTVTVTSPGGTSNPVDFTYE